jgi:hypothetical protein
VLRTVKRSRILRALMLGLIALAGCASLSKPDDKSNNVEAVIPNAPERPQVVTDLSKLSAATTTAPPSIAVTQAPLQAKSPGDKASQNEVVTHRLAADAATTRYNPEPPEQVRGGTKLLNDKARQFAKFSDILLTQTIRAVQELEPDKLEKHRVSDDLKPVVLTAVLDPQGRLNEIVIDQHSGDLRVDHLMIEACKKGIWSRNPPSGARAIDGNYRLRVEGMLFNSSFDRYGEYTYDAELGLAIE